MSTFTITDTVTQPYQGNTGPVSLVNQGPSTVYLSSTPGADPLNGFTLPPMGQMQWDGQSALFAVCASGSSATLVSHPGAGPLDANRSRFWSLLYQRSPALTLNDTVEVGHCETIMIKVTMTSNTTVTFPTIIITWLDANDNFIDTDVITAATIATGSASTRVDMIYRVPVVGTFAQIAGSGGQRVQIFGSDRGLSFRSYSILTDNTSTGPALFVPPTTFVSEYFGSDGFTLQSWSGTYSNDSIYIANLSQRIGLTVNAAGITVAGNVLVRTGTAGTPLVTLFTIPLPTGSTNTYQEIIVPLKELVFITASGALAGGNISVKVTWKDN